MLTVSELDFREMCERLAEFARPYAPDLVVGIATGGVHVASAVCESLGDSPPVVTAVLSRPGTAVKKRFRSDLLLRALPTRTAYLLRWLEVVCRERFLTSQATTAEPDAVFSGQASRTLVASGQRVLIVDDTVDSGRTLQAAAESVRHYNPTCQIKHAVIASTWRNPPVIPDYVLHPRTLIRFHWSLDT